MKLLKCIPVAFCITLLLTQCSKDVNKLSQSPESRILTPALIFGKWNLLKEKDTTFYPGHFVALSWDYEKWFYKFCDSGILEVGNNNFIDSFTYYFNTKECIKIGWQGDTYTDTILKLTEKDFVFKHWEDNADNTKTKQVLYLSR
jgi:hypothetical protein